MSPIIGQMHGVVRWSTHATSTLITWQDQRTRNTAILQHDSTLRPGCHAYEKLFEKTKHAGFGVASLLWLKHNEKSENKFDLCGTIMDCLVGIYAINYVQCISTGMASNWRLVH